MEGIANVNRLGEALYEAANKGNTPDVQALLTNNPQLVNWKNGDFVSVYPTHNNTCEGVFILIARDVWYLC